MNAPYDLQCKKTLVTGGHGGKPGESNLAYGLTKRVLHAAVEAYRRQYALSAIYLLPANLYGPGDSIDPEDSHVIPGLIRRFVESADSGADTVSVWGDGLSTREFLCAQDCARAIVLAAERYDDSAPVNLGSDREISVSELSEIVGRLAGFAGRIQWDTSRPSGQRRRCYDSSLSVSILDSHATTSPEDGLATTMSWYRSQARAEARPG